MSKTVRVRFAPSPTGPMHIGGVRTALFNYLFARQEHGAFLIRLEDTDRQRSQTKYEQEILDSLRWLDLEWDGEVRRQSEYLAHYQHIVNDLIKQGVAYVGEETDRSKSFPPRAGVRKAIKLTVPKQRIQFDDLVHGAISFDGNELGDFVIQKSDGFPTYHLACVADDHEMGITHVIRGDDHLSNTPRQLVIYNALGWNPPEFAHLPLVFGPDRTPLAKRQSTVSLANYREAGYLPEALLNYLALLGWAPGGSREFMTREELLGAFRLEDVHKTNACFDAEKLEWLNGEHIRRLPNDRYVARAKAYLDVDDQEASEKVAAVALLYKDRIRTFSELKTQCAFFFADPVQFDPVAVRKYLSRPKTRGYLERWTGVLQTKGNFDDPQALEQLLRKTADEMGIDARDLIHPTRVAISGRAVTPSLFDVMALVGKQNVLKRIEYVTIHFSKL